MTAITAAARAKFAPPARRVRQPLIVLNQRLWVANIDRLSSLFLASANAIVRDIGNHFEMASQGQRGTKKRDISICLCAVLWEGGHVEASRNTELFQPF